MSSVLQESPNNVVWEECTLADAEKHYSPQTAYLTITRSGVFSQVKTGNYM